MNLEKIKEILIDDSGDDLTYRSCNNSEIRWYQKNGEPYHKGIFYFHPDTEFFARSFKTYSEDEIGVPIIIDRFAKLIRPKKICYKEIVCYNEAECEVCKKETACLSAKDWNLPRE